MRLEAMAMKMPEVAGHPNRIPFEGVLTTVDEPSTRPPSGAKGHRVVLTSEGGEGSAAVAAGDGDRVYAGLGWARCAAEMRADYGCGCDWAASCGWRGMCMAAIFRRW